MTGLPSVGLISHGTSSPTGQVLIEVLATEIATDLRIRGIADEVMLGHVDVQKPDVDEVIARLPADRPVILVPLLLSAGYHVHVDLAEAVDRAAESDRDVRRTPTLGPDPRLAEILADRLPALGDNDDVILAAAGSSDERANESCREMGRLLAAELERPVEVGFLAGGGVPLKDLVGQNRSRGARPVLANYLLAPGFFDDLARKHVEGGTDSAGFLAPPLLTGGGTTSAVPPKLVDIVRDRVREGIRGQVRDGVLAAGLNSGHGGAHAEGGCPAYVQPHTQPHNLTPQMLNA
ncbi:MAG: sirohydrochlorin chelatase [Actinomycetota bacterium]|uniref:sirohydrochlorin chelatase n=1 Tax=Brevibacterium sp. CSND-B09 TaxID=3462571 RepID=UPI003F2362B6